MIFTAENILLIGSVLIFSSILISKTGYRFGIPTLLLFLLVGMFFGSDGLGLQFNSAEDAQFIGMMALSIILFSGGMDTKYQDIKPVLTPGIILSTVGVLLTTLLTGSFIFLLSEWNRTNIELDGFPAAGRHHVVYRFGLGLQPAALAENEPEGKPSPHAGTGKRK